MSGKASSSQPKIGLSGSGALSHVYIRYPPLYCSISESRGLHYDDGNKLLITTLSNQIFSWKTVPFNPFVSPSSDLISEGPVLSIRFSLDSKLVAVQRSGTEIQFWNRETKETFSQRCRSESESILGFFWTDCPLGDIVIVKTSGLDLFAYNSVSKSLDLVETRKLNVSWYVYTHESRLVLLASGLQCKTLTGFQLSSAGVIRLPKFEMAMGKPGDNSKPVLAAEDIYIITVYGRIYCLQVDRIAMLLHSYRFYRDAVVQQGSLPIYSSKIAVSVVDNVLLVHQIDAKVVILYDIFADSRAPISAPLPLLLRKFPQSYALSARSTSPDSENLEVNCISDHEASVYGENWIFLVPDLICDISNKLLWKVNLDLEAISASSSDVPSVLEFLQRRKLDANKAKLLCLGMTRTVILERRPVSMVAKAIDVLVTSYSHSIKTGSYFKGIKNEKTSSDVPNASGPASGGDASTSKIDVPGKSIRAESNAAVDGERLNISLSLSDSESDSDIEFQKRNTNDSQLGISKMDKVSSAGAESSVSEVPTSSLESQLPGPVDSAQLTSPVVSPDEIYRFVFALVEEEMVGDPSYLIAIIVEFLRSASLEKIKVQSNIYMLTVQLLAHHERYSELGLFIMNKIIEPSKEVALQLLEAGQQNTEARKWGLDMLRQLSLHHDYVLSLLHDGYDREALRYARKHEVTTVPSSLFLEAAASHDAQHLAAVLRFFSDFIPDFQKTSDFNTYHRTLIEITSSIAA